MGHSHHWHLLRDIPPGIWRKICDDVRLVLPQAGMQLAQDAAHPELPPRIDDNEIMFNGTGIAACEDFRVSRRIDDRRGQGFYSVKTDHFPYDLPVRCVLAIARQHAPRVFTVSSDAKTLADWRAPLIFCQAVLGREIPFPISDPEKT